ncbi:MAG: TrkH family potassium uptake protein, partial [Acidobacteriota bacterium]|nr:TrkH family potassium uptake protein [Acidobacteriota bacterium]
AAWGTASLAGALPWIVLEGSGFWVNAIFESVSGFTTTGASILTDIEARGPAILLWRSLTQWLGGMGIIVLGIAVLPKLAVGGLELLGAEAPGPIKEKLTPRIAQTAKALWGIYALLTLIEVTALVLAGMGLFDAVNHAFATMATGGFSTLNSSVSGFASPLIEWIIIVFMILAGANFALHFHLLRGKPGPLLQDREFRYYVSIMALATSLICADLMLRAQQEMSLLDAFRDAAFQAVAITTTTGFATADFELWPAFSRALLFLLMFIGGCAGSTGGSIKVVRIMITVKKLVIDLKRKVQPHAVLPVRIGPTAVPDDVVNSVTTFLLLFVALFAAGGLLLTMLGIDPTTAFSASAACIANVGPGFGDVGPTLNYGGLPATAKLILLGLMLVGRLELYTLLVLLFLRRGRRKA